MDSPFNTPPTSSFPPASPDPPASPSNPCDIPTWRPTTPKSLGWDTTGVVPLARPSTPKSVVRLDDLFNFQIVVFQVENTLFQVLKNGFNVPGTPFEGMFALPHLTEIDSSLEGSSLGNPIHLPGISADYFRIFLRILYPFIGPTPVVGYDEWVGVLHLATMWYFKEIRAKAIAALSSLLTQKTLPQRISLGRTYRVVDWVREGYVELAKQDQLELEDLREPSSFALDWETIARICHIRERNAIETRHNVSCSVCGAYTGPNYGFSYCKCRFLASVDEIFRVELQGMRSEDHWDDPLPLPDTPEDVRVNKKGKKKKM